MMNTSSTLRTNLLAGSGSVTNGARTRADVDHIGAFNFIVNAENGNKETILDF